MLLPLTDHREARVALRHRDDALTYGALHALALAHVRTLHALGVRAGDRVAVWASIELGTVVALYGERARGLRVGARQPGGRRRASSRTSSPTPSPRVLVGAPGRAVPSPRSRSTSPTCAARAAARSDARAPALVLYTSGTTGRPKGAVLSHGALAANLDALARAWGWTADDALVHALPLFHVHGLALGLFGTLRRGASLDLLPRFEPSLVAASLSRGATMLFGVPTMYHRLVEHAERDPVARRAGARAAPRVGLRGAPAARAPPHRGRERPRRPRALRPHRDAHQHGRPRVVEGPARATWDAALDGVALRLVDDARAPLDAHDDATLGEVAVRGPNLFDGYLNRPDATAAVRDDEGWFYTGDLAARAPDGDDPRRRAARHGPHQDRAATRSARARSRPRCSNIPPCEKPP